MKLEANVVLARCSNKALYGMRVEKKANDWFRTWAFPIKEGDAAEEGFDNVTISGSFYAEEGYPGCPYCGRSNFIVCGVCKKISCWNPEEEMAPCF